MAGSERIQSVKEQYADPAKKYAYWKAEITAAEKEQFKWHEQSQRVIKRYLDKRDALESDLKNFNLFHANTNIVAASLYSQPPRPDVRRRFNDMDDDVGRVAAMMMERCLAQDLQDDAGSFDESIRSAIQDWLIVGCGSVWLRIHTDFESFTEVDPETGGEETFRKVKEQEIVVDHVAWDDLLWSPCRTWAERRWVGRKVYMDRDALVARFGQEVGEAIPLDFNPRPGARDKNLNNSNPENQIVAKATIYELWDRTNRTVCWLSCQYPSILDEKPDFLQLPNFEPCPKPLFTGLTTNNVMPQPEFVQCQDQYRELDDINNRLSKLIQACKVVGVYDKTQPGIPKMLLGTYDNQLVPVDNWAMFGEKGGLKGQMDFLPLEQIVLTIEKLRVAREDIKQQIYEITGISDIVRGSTKASETLGAQEIKAEFSSQRIQTKQTDVERFARDILRIKADLIAKHLPDEWIVQASNIEATPDVQYAEPALEVIRSSLQREFKINVETFSMAQADFAREKKDRVELVGAIGVYLEKALPVVQGMPQMAPLLAGILKFAVSGFRVGKELEAIIDQAMAQMLQQPPQPGDASDPEAAKREAEVEGIREKNALQRQRDQMQLQNDREKMQNERERREMTREQDMLDAVTNDFRQQGQAGGVPQRGAGVDSGRLRAVA